MKRPFLAGFVLGGIVATISIYVTNMPPEIPDPLAYASVPSTPTGICSFGVTTSGGVIQAVDWQALQPIGYFEKYAGGKVALITPEGYAPDVTECFKDEALKKFLPEITTAANGPKVGDSAELIQEL
ncbi:MULTISPECIES: hypothetical protein [Aeromonas]|uniref:hypothetical protein n=1 Tax=Aeromonas TaxID=642 RepID=UPI002B05D2C9|nr:hypothetical protein [Aeromonas jandaei]